MKFFLTLPLPPSDNHIYASVKKKRRVLTPEARRYQWRVKEAVSDALMWRPELDFEKDDAFQARIVLFLPEIENKGWPKKTKRRFKKIDVQNRQKLVIDSVMGSLGLPDENIMAISMKKDKSVKPRVTFILERIEWD